MRRRGLLWLLPLVSCAAPGMDSPTLADDTRFLDEQGEAIRLASGDGWIVVSPELQGRVMTSGLAGDQPGFGFLDRDRIADPPTTAPFRNFGGEDRFWLGPEGGPFALYFGGSRERDLDHWQVPADLNEGPWRVLDRRPDAVELGRRLQVVNAVGTRFLVDARRRIEIPAEVEIAQLVGGLPAGAAWVGFRSRNRVRNAGDRAWTPEEGLICIWILSQFRPGDRAWVIAPFRRRGDGPPVRADYFGQVPPDRLRLGDGFALFRVDARHRSKIGVLRDRALPVAGSYDPDTGVLTLVRFGPIDTTARYVDETWPIDQADPFAGDVLNSYNHGGPEPFYEIESSSPALELAPGGEWEHEHLVVHLRFRSPEDLAAAASHALGVDWDQVRRLAGWE
ncbi:MAG: hypothetical protein D6702_02615 [Planctomycetota bacterium]|nr:MAG: hypothetical protein D6702_02615 [Planctomycetota bacterium]